ncbi:hypothetical protein LCGC14_2518760 [marine sediment metagenome]|uniref:Uncharacterized protein n=1 Tax=marine sediment metagenome TaxID=412755 RepID=A0A0F9AX29_9ZZZZ
MRITIQTNSITVEREKTDKKYYNNFGQNSWGDGESQFLHNVKKALNALGYDLIKKRMHKDGHLVDDKQQYLRDRKRRFCLYNDHWAINGLNEDFNNGKAILRIETLQ